VNNLYYVSHASRTGNHIPEISKELHSTYWHYFGSNKRAPTKVYISRNKTKGRRILNEKELIPILKKHGFSVYFMEDLEWKEQVSLMHNCEILISAHGSGLTNMLFMNPQGSVLELLPPPRIRDQLVNCCYYSLANALGIHYYYLFGERLRDRRSTRREDMIIDTTKFEKAIEEMELCKMQTRGSYTHPELVSRHQGVCRNSGP